MCIYTRTYTYVGPFGACALYYTGVASYSYPTIEIQSNLRLSSGGPIPVPRRACPRPDARLGLRALGTQSRVG